MALYLIRSTADPSVPDYLRELNELKDEATEKFVKDHLDKYVAMTEDVIWSMVVAFAKRSAGEAPTLARRLLTREVLHFYPVRVGMSGLLRAALARDKHDESLYKIVELASTVYKQASDPVLVLRDDEEAGTISDESLAISMHMDKPDGTDILIALRSHEELRASAAGTLVGGRGRGGPGVSKIRSERPSSGSSPLLPNLVAGVNDGSKSK